MKKITLILLVLLYNSAYTQQIVFVKDSIMQQYMKSGFATKNFMPSGKGNYKTDKQGQWKDYEVSNDFYTIMAKEGPLQVYGKYLLYGEGEFVNNKREGLWTFYAIEDKTFKRMLQKKVNYSNGSKECEFSYYFPDGNRSVSGKFASNVYEGEVKSFYNNGKDFKSTYYKNGLKTATQPYLFPNGKVKAEYHYLNDSLDGNYRLYYTSGSIQETGNYKMGVYEGIYRYYYENGQLWVEKEYRNERLWNIAGSYDSKGKSKDTGTLKDGNGTVLFYTEEGKIYLIQTLQNGHVMKEEKF